MESISLKQLIKDGLETSPECALYDDSCCVVTSLDAGIMRNHMVNKLFPSKLETLAVMFVESGTIALRSGTEVVTSTGPSVVGCRPGSMTMVESVSDDFRSAVVLLEDAIMEKMNFSVEKLIPHLVSIRESRSVQLSENQMKYAAGLLDVLGQCIREQADLAYYHESVRSLVEALVSCLLNIATESVEVVKTAPSAPKSREEENFHRFMKLIREHFRQERKITFYAQEMCLSPKYLSSMIRRFSGKSPSQWIDECVIAEAKNLLKFSDKNIQEIAFELHFPTQSFFGRFFKHHTGCSPRTFKTMN